MLRLVIWGLLPNPDLWLDLPSPQSTVSGGTSPRTNSPGSPPTGGKSLPRQRWPQPSCFGGSSDACENFQSPIPSSRSQFLGTGLNHLWGFLVWFGFLIKGIPSYCREATCEPRTRVLMGSGLLCGTDFLQTPLFRENLSRFQRAHLSGEGADVKERAKPPSHVSFRKESRPGLCRRRLEMERRRGKVGLSARSGLLLRTDPPGPVGKDREVEEVSQGAQVAAPVRLGSSSNSAGSLPSPAPCPPHLCPPLSSPKYQSVNQARASPPPQPPSPSHCSNSPCLPPQVSLSEERCLLQPRSSPCGKG